MTDTQTPTIPNAASPSAGTPAVPPDRRGRWWAVPLVVVGYAALALVGVAAVVPSGVVADEVNVRVDEVQPTPYARIPSSAQPVTDRITFGGLGGVTEVYPPDQDIYFVTVSEPSQSVLSWWIGHDEPAIEFLTEEEKFGVQTPEQRRVFALESMRTSEQVAQFVALQAVGFDVEVVPGDVLIQQMVCIEPNDDGTECVRFSPSDDVLDPGDRIIAVEGEPIDGVEDLGAALEGLEPGDEIELTIERPGEGELDVVVELTASPQEPDRTIVGFVPFDTREVVLPFELNIDTGRIGGPSAGLAFTLALIDQLTPGSLTGDVDVAVTGTIELDGSVGAIGGLRQKAAAVDQADVEVFLVPAAQSDDDLAIAREAGGDVRIIAVATLDEALEVLEELGGDPVEDVGG